MIQIRTRLTALILAAFGALVLALAVAALPEQARAYSDTQLVMMEEAGCSWCDKWREEIGVIYDRTKEGRTAPLRRVDVHGRMPKDLKFLKPAYFTPTFILVAGGREIGRIQGYPGEDFFWPMLGELLDKLPDEQLKAEASHD
ncbi:MAG: transcriptional regulator [Filomicrobium sp.]